MDKNIIFTLLILLIISAILFNFYLYKLIDNNQNKENVNKIIIKEIKEIKEDIKSPYEKIHDLDIKVLYDPLEESTKRIPSHQLIPIMGNPLFNYPTRGFTDSYSLYGYLTRDNNNNNDNNNDNNDMKMNTSMNDPKDLNLNMKNNPIKDNNYILKLFGRQKFPNSNEYEYYVSIHTGFNDDIKYTLENRRKELYDGDKVFIDIIGSNYIVKLNKTRDLTYNPYIN